MPKGRGFWIQTAIAPTEGLTLPSPREDAPSHTTVGVLKCVSNFTRWTTQRNRIFEVVKELTQRRMLPRLTVVYTNCSTKVRESVFQLTDNRGTWNNVQAEYSLRPYIPIVKTRGFTGVLGKRNTSCLQFY